MKDLEQANEDMGNEFMSFYDFILSCGMLDRAPDIARRLNDSMRKFVSLARKSTEDDCELDYDANPESEITPTSESRRKGSKQSTGASSSPNLSSVATSSQSHCSSQNQNDADPSTTHMPTSDPPQRYEIIAEPTPDNASFPIYGSGDQHPFCNNPYVPSPYNTLSSPSSYAFQEPTLGRRLQRLTLEAGFRLVTMSNPPPERYAAVFGFCLLFETRDAIKHRLSFCLNSTSQDSLFYWKYPFSNLGGAGLHSFSHDYSMSLSGVEVPVESRRPAPGRLRPPLDRKSVV